MGLARLNDPSEIDVVLRMLAEVDAILEKAEVGLGHNLAMCALPQGWLRERGGAYRRAIVLLFTVIALFGAGSWFPSGAD